MKLLILFSAIVALSCAQSQYKSSGKFGSSNYGSSLKVQPAQAYRKPAYQQPIYKPVPVAVAQPIKPKYESSGYEIPIVRQSQNVNDDGSYSFNYETGNGIIASETRSVSQSQPSGQVVGSYKYTSPEGIPVEIAYYADENGFQAQGDAIPVAPAIPELILRSLEYNRIHAGEYDEFGAKKAGFSAPKPVIPVRAAQPVAPKPTLAPYKPPAYKPTQKPVASKFQPLQSRPVTPQKFNQGQFYQGQYKQNQKRF